MYEPETVTSPVALIELSVTGPVDEIYIPAPPSEEVAEVELGVLLYCTLLLLSVAAWPNCCATSEPMVSPAGLKSLIEMAVDVSPTSAPHVTIADSRRL